MVDTCYNYSFIIIPPLPSFSSDKEFRRILSLLRECGYHGVEFNLTDPLGIDRNLLLRWVDEAGLSVPALLTGEAYKDGFCLSSSDGSIRQRTVERLVQYVETARDFNAVLVVGLLQGLRSDEPDPEIANARIADCMIKLVEATENSGVEIVFEPVNHLQVGFNNTVSGVLKLIQRIGSPLIKPMVDTIHLNVEERSLTQPILECGADLAHVHLADSNGSLFGTGRVDFSAVLETLDQIKYSRFVSVKVYRDATLEIESEWNFQRFEQAARSSIEYLRRLSV